MAKSATVTCTAIGVEIVTGTSIFTAMTHRSRRGVAENQLRARDNASHDIMPTEMTTTSTTTTATSTIAQRVPPFVGQQQLLEIKKEATMRLHLAVREGARDGETEGDSRRERAATSWRSAATWFDIKVQFGLADIADTFVAWSGSCALCLTVFK